MVRWKTTENNKHAARQFGNEQEMIYMLPAFKFAGGSVFWEKNSYIGIFVTLLQRIVCYNTDKLLNNGINTTK